MANTNTIKHLKGKLIEKDNNINELKAQLSEKKEYTFRVNYENFMNNLVDSTEYKLGEYVKYNLKSGGFVQFDHVKGINTNIPAYLDGHMQKGLINNFINSGLGYSAPNFDINPESVVLPVLDFLVLMKWVSINYSKYFHEHSYEWKLVLTHENENVKESGCDDYLYADVAKLNYTIVCIHAHRRIITFNKVNKYDNDEEKKYSMRSAFQVLRFLNDLYVCKKITKQEHDEMYNKFFELEWDFYLYTDTHTLQDVKDIFRIIENEVIPKYPNPVFIRDFEITLGENMYIAKCINDEHYKYYFTKDKKMVSDSNIYKMYKKEWERLKKFTQYYEKSPRSGSLVKGNGHGRGNIRFINHDLINKQTLTIDEIFVILSAIEHYKTIEK